MPDLNPRLHPDAPIELIEARPLFRSDAVRHRGAASLCRLESGRILMAFRLGRGPNRANDGAIVVTYSDDNGENWDEPHAVYAYPGWDCLPMGGIVRFADNFIQLLIGRVKLDFDFAGDEPFDGWSIAPIDSRDGGITWSEAGAEISLFPYWTEMYGASNPHPLSDGRFMLACMGTHGRDTGWHSGVTFCGPEGVSGLTRPIIFAEAHDRNFSDTDLVRLADGRFVAAIREHVTRQTFWTRSDDEGQTWLPIKPTGFKGSNIKLVRLRSGTILCAYRDEDPAQHGVGCSISDDGGDTWRPIGHLYLDPGARHEPGIVCGYPDFVYTSPTELLGVLHTYVDAAGNIDLYQLRLGDRS